MANKNTQLIEVKTRGATKSKKQIQGVSNGLKSMAKSAAIAASAYFGARGLINAMKSSLSLYAEQELAEVKLESALGKTAAGLKKYASALQQTTRFGDELILQGMAQLAFFIKDEEQLKIATKATLDLASAKGMDLVQAADLVAKSVGSSTNALSRYGIAAEGAVGSEGRLLSITDEIANLFGGQAEATTESYQGAIDQLSNSFGDMQEVMGESLAPTIQGLARAFNDLLKTPVSEQIEKERNEFIKLTDALLNVNTSETTRERIITKLQEIYPEYLGSLDLEKASLEDIATLQKKVTEALHNKIVEQRFAEEEANINAEIIKETERLYELETKALEGTVGTYRDFIDFWNGEGETWQERLESAQENRILALENEKLELEKNREEFQEWLSARIDGEEVIENENDNLNKQIDIVKDLDAVWANFIKHRKAVTKAEEKAESVGRKTIDNLQKTGAAFKEFKKLAQNVAVADTLYDTYKSAQAAYTNFQEFPAAKLNPPLFMALGAAAATVAVGAGLARVNEIRSAQYGADFVTSGPQMMMVGEGSGPERVQVTPLVDSNLEGPQGGGGITLNISGNVLHESFVEDNIIPQIREGIRLGENIGL